MVLNRKIVVAYVKLGKIKEAVEAARLLKSKLFKEEVDEIIRVNEECGNLGEALAAAEYACRKEKAKELALKIIKAMEGHRTPESIAEFAREHECWAEANKFEQKVRAEKIDDEAERVGVRGINDGVSGEEWGDRALAMLSGGNYEGVFFLTERTSHSYAVSEAAAEWLIKRKELNILVRYHRRFRFSRSTNERIKNLLLADEQMYSCAICFAEEAGQWTTLEERDGVVAMLVEKDRVDDARKFANNTCVSERAFESLLSGYVKSGRLKGALEMAKAARRSLTVNETAKIIKFCLEERGIGSHGHNTRAAAEAAKLGTTQEMVDALIRCCIKDGEISIPKLAGELKASKQVVEELLAHSVQEGYIDYADQSANLLGRELTWEELDVIIDNNLPKASGRGFHEPYAMQAVRLGASPESIRKVREAAVTHGGLEAAEECAKLLGEELTQEEIQKIVDKCIQYNWVKQAVQASKLLS